MSDPDKPARIANGQRRYHTLDGLRGFSALMVASYHLGLSTVQAVPYGYLAVDFFFMLSGFVIALSYQRRLEQGMPFWRFSRARIVRLYPMFLLGLIVSIPAKHFKADMSGSTPVGIADAPPFLVNAMMLPSPFTNLLFPFNGALWSLFVEMLISLAFGALLYRASDRLLVALMLAAAACIVFLTEPPDYIDMGWGWSNLPGGVARACFGFPLGMLMFRHLGGMRCRKTWWAFVPVVVLAGMMMTYVVPEYQITRDLAAVFLVLPATLAIGIILEPPASVRRLFSGLGDISYPAYVLHSPLIFVTAFAVTGTDTHKFMVYAAFLLGLCVISLLAAHFVDAPVRGWLLRKVDTDSGKAEAALSLGLGAHGHEHRGLGPRHAARAERGGSDSAGGAISRT